VTLSYSIQPEADDYDEMHTVYTEGLGTVDFGSDEW